MRGARRRWLVAAAGAAAVLALTTLLARTGRVPAVEETVFRAVNTAPAWLHPALWPIMQLGNVVVAAAAAVVAGALLRRWQVAVGGVIAVVAAWYVAKVVKRVVERGRPETLLADVRIPGLHEGDFGFVSGHSAVAFALATVVAGALPRRARWIPFTVATIVGVARLYVGVHLPLDVIGGAAAGVAIGSLVNAVVEG